MDPDKRRLIDQLCTQAGMIMEDCSAAAIGSRENSENDLSQRLGKLAADAKKTTTLLDAARALLE